MKKILLAIAALFSMTLSFAQEYMILENINGAYARFDVDIIKQAYFKTYEASGEGTAENPFNVAAANAKCKEIGPDPSTEQYYVKGYVVSVSSYYFYIADDKDGINRIYTEAYLPGAYELKRGDEVVVYCSLYSYNNLTPEMIGQITSINGQKIELPEPKGSGTLEDPYNVQAAIEYIKALGADVQSEKDIYIKGYVTTIKEQYSAQYGNAQFTMSDSKGGGNSLIFYRGLYLGNRKWTDGDLSLSEGDEVIICGKVVYYKGTTPETVQNAAYLYSLNGKTEGGGGSGDTPSGDGDGTEAKPYDVTAAIAKAEQAGVFVKAFIVGFVEGQAYTEGANFSAASTTQTNILIAANASETDAAKCMPVQLPTGDIRTKLNLKDNAGNYKKEVLLYGDITKYFGVPGLKNTKYAVIDGTAIGTNPSGGGGTSSGDGIKTVTITEFNNAAESDEVWYQLTGTVKNLKDGDQYGNFDLEDATGSVYVYGLLSEKGGAKKQFQDLVAAKGIKNGSKITIIGLRSSYNGQIQVKNAYFVSIEGGSSSGGGDATGADGSTIISVADFNAAAESTDVWYQLTGTIKNLKDGDQYGNFDIEDETGSVYVYGLLATKGGEKKKFQDLVAAKGIANGKKITIVGTRGEYNGKIEVMNAYFVSIEGGNDTSGNTGLETNFANGQGAFTIEDKDLGALSFVWKADSKGYMKASAYANATNNAAESWLVSPTFSLKNATTPVMTFNNCCNYTKEGNITDYIKVMIFDGANWNEAAVSNLPDGKSWTFVDSTVDLKPVAGKENVKIAFKYVSTTVVAPTWEIKTVSIK